MVGGLGSHIIDAPATNTITVRVIVLPHAVAECSSYTFILSCGCVGLWSGASGGRISHKFLPRLQQTLYGGKFLFAAGGLWNSFHTSILPTFCVRYCQTHPPSSRFVHVIAQHKVVGKFPGGFKRERKTCDGVGVGAGGQSVFGARSTKKCYRMEGRCGVG